MDSIKCKSVDQIRKNTCTQYYDVFVLLWIGRGKLKHVGNVCFHEPLSEQSALISGHYHIKWDGLSFAAVYHLLKPSTVLSRDPAVLPDIMLIKIYVTIT